MRSKVLFAAVTVVAMIAIPAVVTGQQVSRVGGSPSNVYLQNLSHVCLDTALGGVAMEQEISVSVESHVLVYFTTRWGRLGEAEEASVSLALDDVQTFGWNMPGNRITRTTQTVMWTFPDVQPGMHTVRVLAFVVDSHPFGGLPGPASADATECALAAFVMPKIS